ncbi:hypothetical protein QA648_00485 [Rhizobium sp. CB3171]|uniref:hypothetical protein n=1 Tax=Rhizobium sp. CB3171 TaxID=3039157 RepID=UPI0024B25BCF|nr:hypothetical protein [Rhizobium sp. CB3171]WFU02296.1 hypothetical protein QA648_00485 [Rhizobium sp. CB3171]
MDITKEGRELDLQLWTSDKVVGAVIATGVVSASFRELIEFVKGHRKKRREARYLSVSAAVALEAFAIECKDLVDMMEANYEQYQAVGSINIPSPPKLPTDCDWRLIDVTLMNELLSFENGVRQAQADAEFSAHFEGNSWSHVSAVSELMEKAQGLAAQLRANIGLS